MERETQREGDRERERDRQTDRQTDKDTERLRASTTFRSVSGFALPSMHHHNSPAL